MGKKAAAPVTTLKTMSDWQKRGYAVRGTRFAGIFIASRRNQHAVLRLNFFDELVHENDEEFYYSEGQALDAAKELTLATV